MPGRQQTFILTLFGLCNTFLYIAFVMRPHATVASKALPVAIASKGPQSPISVTDRIASAVEALGSRLTESLGFDVMGLELDTEDLDWLQGSPTSWSSWSQSTVYVADTGAFHPSRPASFGPHITHDAGLAGHIAPAWLFETALYDSDNPCCPYAHKVLTQLSPFYEPPEDWIALVQRGQCGFAEKVRHAQAMGAIAVIVGDDQYHAGLGSTIGGPALIGMYAPEATEDIRIPSCFVSHQTYVELTRIFNSYHSVHRQFHQNERSIAGYPVILSKDELVEWETSDMVLLLLFLPSILTFCTLATHRYRQSRARREERAPREVVNKVPWVRWGEEGVEKHERANDADQSSREEGSEDLEAARFASRPWISSIRSYMPYRKSSNASSSFSTPPMPFSEIAQYKYFSTQKECAICLSDFAQGEAVRCLPCQHLLHASCVDPWLLQTKRYCPLCRLPIDAPPTNFTPGSSPIAASPIAIDQAQNNSGPPIASSSTTGSATHGNATERTPLLRSSPS